MNKFYQVSRVVGVDSNKAHFFYQRSAEAENIRGEYGIEYLGTTLLFYDKNAQRSAIFYLENKSDTLFLNNYGPFREHLSFQNDEERKYRLEVVDHQTYSELKLDNCHDTRPEHVLKSPLIFVLKKNFVF